MEIEVSDAMRVFITERHHASLATLRADGSPHVVPVGFTFDGRRVRVITRGGSMKVANARRGGRAAVSQVDGGRWVTFEGPVTVLESAAEVADAVSAYAGRYKQPAERDDRVVIAIEVDHVMCSRSLR